MLTEMLESVWEDLRRPRTSSTWSNISMSAVPPDKLAMTEEYIEMLPQGDEPPSMEHILASEIYPKTPLTSDDANLTVPFPILPGENVQYLGRTAEGVIALSNFRLFIRHHGPVLNIPLALIDTIEGRDIFFLYVYCKDARSLRCVFSTNEACMEWYKRLSNALNPPHELHQVFAFAFHAWCMDYVNASTNNPGSAEMDPCYQLCQPMSSMTPFSFGRDVERMGFDLKKAWKISYVNDTFQLCSTYPQLHILPEAICDKDMEDVASFRSSRRFPSVVWRDQRNGAVIARSSQPEVGWLGWRSTPDENLLQAISKACAITNPTAGSSSKMSNGHVPTEGEVCDSDKSSTSKKMLIIDARSYAAAVANRAKGGGCECPEYYANCEIQFMSLANIHSIRKSFQALRSLCAAIPDQTAWLSGLEGTKWLQHIGGLLRAAQVVVNAIDGEGRPVLVHCSDGWDRTPQITGLAELMLDPYYRTMEGFQVLVEREWIEFGHKFADRCALGMYTEDTNERCPVFLQFLDCVHQLLRQFPCAFQFNTAYLVKLLQHTYSCLFGNFLCNSASERQENSVTTKTCSVWSLLQPSNNKFRNYTYMPNAHQVLHPSCHIRHLHFWSAVYLQSTEGSTPTGSVEPAAEVAPSEESLEMDGAATESIPLTKTRSCDDIVAAIEAATAPTIQPRRLSDPNIGSDPNCLLQSAVTELPHTKTVETDQTVVASATVGKANESDSGIDNGEVVNDIVVNGVEGEDKLTGDERDKVADTTASVATMTIAPEMAVNEKSTDTLTGDSHAETQAVTSAAKCTNHHSPSSPDEAAAEQAGGKMMVMNLDGEPICNGVLSEDEEDDTLPLGTRSTISTSTTELSDSHVNISRKLQHACRGNGTLLSMYIPEGVVPVAPSQRAADAVASSGASSASVDSDICTPPMQHSRTPSSTTPPTPATERSCWPMTSRGAMYVQNQPLDCDGLSTWLEPGQTQLAQMESEYLLRIEMLQRQLDVMRVTVYHYTCGTANSNLHQLDSNKEENGSQGDSCETGELGSQGGSDASWEPVEEGDARMTLWVPDHAVTHCAGCHHEFWIVRRKHHCRNCGRVFCGECTSFTMPVPQQQLNEPVRVCRNCFANIREGELDLCVSSFTTLDPDVDRMSIGNSSTLSSSECTITPACT